MKRRNSSSYYQFNKVPFQNITANYTPTLRTENQCCQGIRKKHSSLDIVMKLKTFYYIKWIPVLQNHFFKKFSFSGQKHKSAFGIDFLSKIPNTYDLFPTKQILPNSLLLSYGWQHCLKTKMIFFSTLVFLWKNLKKCCLCGLRNELRSFLLFLLCYKCYYYDYRATFFVSHWVIGIKKIWAKDNLAGYWFCDKCPW